MRVYGCRINRRTFNAGSRTYASQHTAEVFSSTNHGISKGEECTDDIRQTREFKVQVREQALLGRRVLRKYGGA